MKAAVGIAELKSRGIAADALASFFSVTERRVRQLVEDGTLPKPRRYGVYDAHKCVAAWLKYATEGRRPSAVVGARARDFTASAKLKEARLREFEGKLVDVDEMREALASFGVTLAAALDGAAGRVTASVHEVCGGDRQRIFTLLFSEHRRIREQMATDLEALCKERRRSTASPGVGSGDGERDGDVEPPPAPPASLSEAQGDER